jgi:hypothetical protein
MTELLSNRAMWAGAGINHDQRVGGSMFQMQLIMYLYEQYGSEGTFVTKFRDYK